MFHYNEAILRKVRQLGLWQLYTHCAEFNEYVVHCMAAVVAPVFIRDELWDILLKKGNF